MTEEIIKEFVEQSIYRMEESTRMINKCYAEVSEQEIWIQPNNSSNSIGNLILHLCGNIRQYVISSLGGKEDIRERNKEFTEKGYSKNELIEKLISTLQEAKTVIRSANPTALLRKRNVQGFHFSGIGIIIHVTEHYSYHTGQIALLTKLLKDKDLGFYRGTDLTIKNQE